MISSRQHIITLLTLVATGCWVASIVARAFLPQFTAGTSVDAVMVLIVGWWFTSQPIRRNGYGS